MSEKRDTLQESAEKFAERAWLKGGRRRADFLAACHNGAGGTKCDGAFWHGAAVGMVVERMAEDGWVLQLTQLTHYPGWGAEFLRLAPEGVARCDSLTVLGAVLGAALAAIEASK